MNSNTKLEIAIEILAAKIAMLSKSEYSLEHPEMKQLINEREKIYKGDEMIMDKIIKYYGPEIKKNYEQI